MTNCTGLHPRKQPTSSTEDGEYRAVRMVVTVDSGVDDDVVRDQMGWVADDADGRAFPSSRPAT